MLNKYFNTTLIFMNASNRFTAELNPKLSVDSMKPYITVSNSY